ncbi:MAG TPA: cellulase family glycosylhydrolase [Fimbriimonadaceae bacterium]|nr:cellulase family glycosylhydrolase [Fimbriimonadaceae bacterium]
MLPFLVAAVLTQAPKESWYGPVEISFQLPVVGNPYDPDKNDVQVTFTGGAAVEKRFAFFDGKLWKCRLAARRPGDYTVAVTLNGSPISPSVQPPATIQLATRLEEPFVRIADNRFVLGDGKPYWPIGHSLGWTDPKLYPMLADQLPIMGRNGVNWTRIWSTFWDGRNPYWLVGGAKLPDGAFSQEALEKWDKITRAAEAAGVRFQWTLHNHGQVSSTVNPNWPEHPWSKKNGGFLDKAEDFFTDAEAKRRTRAYLRYVVARYGDSPAIMAWELFNEVQFSDAAQKGHWDTVAAWHAEMAAYLRSIDPYHHLITTSSEIGQKALWTAMDYYQAHGYPASIPAMVQGEHFPTDKPYFWGEVGGPNDADGGDAEHLIERDAIWSGVLAGNQGSAEYWNWDRAMRPGMYDEFRRGSAIISASGLAEQTGLTPSRMKIETATGGILKFAPGVGWGKYSGTDFNLPEDASPEAMGQFSSFFQGASHPDMGAAHATFHFKAPSAGVFRVKIAGVSGGGTTLVALLDGAELKKGEFAAGSKPNETWELPFEAGEHTVNLNNTGGDWVLLGGFSVDGIAPAVSGSAISNDHWALMRLVRGSAEAAPWTANGLTLADGSYKATAWDLDTGASTSWTVKVIGGSMPKQTMSAKDAIITLRRDS